MLRLLLRILTPWRLLGLLKASRRRKKQRLPMPKKVIAGMIIGGAVASIVGKKLVDKHRRKHGDDDVDE